jgi:hypothetical protein
MSRDEDPILFIISMDKNHRCDSIMETSKDDICWLTRSYGCCGDLSKRPKMCPLIEVSKPNEDIKSYKTTWVEK